MPEFDHSFKLLLVGDSGVGKSSILLRFAEDSFDPDLGATIGVDFKVKHITVSHQGRDCRLNLKIWDTAGQERFRTLTSSYYRGAHGVVLVYDITSRESFDHLGTWLQEIDDFKTFPDMAKLLVGNKLDLVQHGEGREVNQGEARELAQEHGMMWIECSAKTKEGVAQAFAELSTKILETATLVDAAKNPAAGRPGLRLGEQPSHDQRHGGGYCC